MGFEALIGVLGIVGTLLLVTVGLLNFSVFRKQLRIARDQIDTAMRQLEIAQKQPDLYLIPRAVTETPRSVANSAESVCNRLPVCKRGRDRLLYRTAATR